MTLEAWLVFVAAETLLCLAPGPAVLIVVSTGLSRGAKASLWTSLGVLSANGVYFALSAFGVGALILASHELFHLIRWVGAAYLIWLGVKALRSAGQGIASARAEDAPEARPMALFRAGLALKLADPKTLYYFIALLPQFVDPAGDLATQIAILATTSVVIEFGVLAGYGVTAGRLHRFARRPRVALWADRLAGGSLIGVGLAMAALRRDP